MKKKVIKDIVLAYSDSKLVNETRDKLTCSGNTKVIHKKAKYDLFADQNAFETRALIALMMGINQYIGGVKGVGVANAY